MTFTAIPDPDGTRKPCGTCDQPTVLVTTATGPERLHCGTFTARCHTANTRTATARGTL